MSARYRKPVPEGLASDFPLAESCTIYGAKDIGFPRLVNGVEKGRILAWFPSKRLKEKSIQATFRNQIKKRNVPLFQMPSHAMTQIIFCTVVLFLGLPQCLTAQADQQSYEVDHLFSRWNSEMTPGVNVVVLRDGKEIYARSFGMASLELGVRNSMNLTYHLGSVSKQFTGYCIQLLAQEGKLSLADDIRKYLPEMQEYGTPITIEMLLTHTSGLRDNVNLLMIKGRRIDDVTSENESFDVIVRQRSLNFTPGTQYQYSNADYVLLAKIVERVSQQQFATFLQTRVFAPLGMKHTSVVSDPLRVTAHRATGYGGDHEVHLHTPADSTYGSSGLLSNIEDMERWSRLFTNPAPNESSIVARMAEPGKLSDGTPITYASGLHVESWHGATYLEHTGAVAGFLSEVLIFPKQRFTLLMLSNTDSLQMPSLAFAIANVFLGKELPLPSEPKAVADASEGELQRYAGTYELVSGTSETGPGRRLHFVMKNQHLYLEGDQNALETTGHGVFYSSERKSLLSFEEKTGALKEWRITLRDANGTEFYGRRRKEEVSKSTPIKGWQLSDYCGIFFSSEIDTAYTVMRDGDSLRVRTPRGEATLTMTTPDHFAMKGDEGHGIISGEIVFTRKNMGINGFLLSASSRARNILFERFAEASSTIR